MHAFISAQKQRFGFRVSPGTSEAGSEKGLRPEIAPIVLTSLFPGDQRLAEENFRLLILMLLCEVLTEQLAYIRRLHLETIEVMVSLERILPDLFSARQFSLRVMCPSPGPL